MTILVPTVHDAATPVDPLFNRFSDTLDSVLHTIGDSVSCVSAAIPEKRKAKYSQYFTPLAIAKQMAAMLDLPAGGHLGDAGAGAGILGAAALALHYEQTSPVSDSCSLKAFEIDETLHAPFLENLSRVADFANSKGHVSPHVDLSRDFTDIANQLHDLFSEQSNTLDAVIINPPYQKLNSQTDIAKMLKGWGVSVPNLYALFMVLALEMLKPGGEMVALVPRSFANGDYFKSFRAWIRRHSSIEGVVRYRSRSNLFRRDNVLQENVIIKLRKGVEQSDQIRVTVCDTAETAPIFEHMLPTSLILPANPEGIMLMPGCPEDVKTLQSLRQHPCSLSDLGVSVSTGKIEEFRYRVEICSEADAGYGAVPMIYAHNWERGDHSITWPTYHPRKLEMIRSTDRTASKIVPRGNYVLLKRISANDDRTGRSHPVLLRESDFGDYAGMGLENHIQYLHINGKGFESEEMATGLVKFLESDLVERALSVISGTTQLNKSDLEALRFPTCHELENLGRTGGVCHHTLP